MTTLPAHTLRVFVAALFSAAGMSEAFAATVSEVLVWANLRGADTHGVVRVPRYLEMIAQGIMNPRASPTVRKETAGTILLDADRAPGPVAMSLAAQAAVRKAKSTGIGAVVIARTTHTAALGFYARAVTAEGCICIAVSSSVPNMPYHGTREAAVATNPLCIGVPGGRRGPLVLDMATSVVSLGTLMLARRTGAALTPGWAIDIEGNPTTDSQKAALPLPMSGPKGAGLSLMIELITSLLASNPILAEVLGGGSRAHRQNGMIIAIDISAFAELPIFEEGVEQVAALITGMARQPGFETIIMPGERGDAVARLRSQSGIPLPPGIWQELCGLAERSGVPLPVFSDPDANSTARI